MRYCFALYRRLKAKVFSHSKVMVKLPGSFNMSLRLKKKTLAYWRVGCVKQDTTLTLYE